MIAIFSGRNENKKPTNKQKTIWRQSGIVTMTRNAELIQRACARAFSPSQLSRKTSGRKTEAANMFCGMSEVGACEWIPTDGNALCVEAAQAHVDSHFNLISGHQPSMIFCSSMMTRTTQQKTNPLGNIPSIESLRFVLVLIFRAVERLVCFVNCWRWQWWRRRKQRQDRFWSASGRHSGWTNIPLRARHLEQHHRH